MMFFVNNFAFLRHILVLEEISKILGRGATIPLAFYFPKKYPKSSDILKAESSGIHVVDKPPC